MKLPNSSVIYRLKQVMPLQLIKSIGLTPLTMSYNSNDISYVQSTLSAVEIPKY